MRTDGASHGIFTSTSGVTPNRIFNIEWRAVYYSGGVSTSSVNFEVRLYENQQRFDVIYGNLNAIANSGLNTFYLEALDLNEAYGYWRVVYGAKATLARTTR